MRAILYLFLFYYIDFVFSIENCLNLDVSITQIVELEGFKRELKWLIEIVNPDFHVLHDAQYKFALRFNTTSAMFVSPDEITDLQRFRNISAYIEGDVNIETPKHESQNHIVYVYIPMEYSQKISVEIPIHLRYQRAQITGGFGKVHLRKPSFLVNIPKDGKRLCGRHPRIEGPCDGSGLENCVWRNVTYQALFDDVELFVPVGNLDDYPLVSIVTLLLGCSACIYVLSILSTVPL